MSWLSGKKTILTAGLGMLMAICQSFGYHEFSPEIWAMLGSTGAVFMRLGMNK